MALAPLRTGPHTIRADRLAFAMPVRVREAAGGHWITLGHHGVGDDEEGGGVHVFIGGGSGPGSGTITKGPKGLLGHHIAALASHPSVSKAQHHPAGHEPPGAREHPHYAEATPNAERQTPNAGQEPAKRPGKPYARLHGAEQGTRQEQIGKALSEAQSAAKGPSQKQAQPPKSHAHARYEREKADPTRMGVPPIPPGKVEGPSDTRSMKAQREGEIAHLAQRGLGEGKAATPVQRSAARRDLDRALSEYGQFYGADAEKALREKTFAENPAGHFDPNAGVTRPDPSRFKAPEAKVADTAVAHQQAQAELAAHRAAHDRNPNPWAPHLSPPVGDAKDTELAEKATRAQLAHQAAQAQQQGAQQQQLTEGQRAHEKEMAQLRSPGRRDQPMVMADGTTRTPQQVEMARAAGADQANTQMRAAGRTTWTDEDHALAVRTMNDILDRNLSLSHPAAERAARKQAKAEPKPAFTAPQEKPQTAPQPEQAAGARAPLQSHEQRLDQAYHQGERAADAAHGAEVRPLDKQIHALSAMLREGGIKDVSPMDAYRLYFDGNAITGTEGMTPQRMREGVEHTVKGAVRYEREQQRYDKGPPSFYDYHARAHSTPEQIEERAKGLFDRQYKQAFPDQRRGSKHYNERWQAKADLARSYAHQEAAARHDEQARRIESGRRYDAPQQQKATHAAQRMHTFASHLAALKPDSPHVGEARQLAESLTSRHGAHGAAHERAIAELRQGAEHHRAEAERYKKQHEAAASTPAPAPSPKRSRPKVRESATPAPRFSAPVASAR